MREIKYQFQYIQEHVIKEYLINNY